MSETFGLSDRETEKKRKVVTPPFSWAQLLPLLFPSDQLWCEHASDALRFGQDTPLGHTPSSTLPTPPPPPPPSTLANGFVSLKLFWHQSFNLCGCLWHELCLRQPLLLLCSVLKRITQDWKCVSPCLYMHLFGVCLLYVHHVSLSLYTLPGVTQVLASNFYHISTRSSVCLWQNDP